MDVVDIVEYGEKIKPSVYVVSGVYSSGSKQYIVPMKVDENGSLTVDLDSNNYALLSGSNIFDGNQIISGSLNVSGTIESKKYGAFAYLENPTTTTIISSGSYQYISGTFSNEYLEDFSVVLENEEPYLKCDADVTDLLTEITFFGTVKANVNNTLVKVSFSKNDVVCTCSEMEIFCKNLEQPYNFGGMGLIKMNKNDKIQLICTANSSDDEITFDEYQVKLKKFF